MDRNLLCRLTLTKMCSPIAADQSYFLSAKLKGLDHVTVNRPVIPMIYIVVMIFAHTWPLCSAQILMDRMNSQ